MSAPVSQLRILMVVPSIADGGWRCQVLGLARALSPRMRLTVLSCDGDAEASVDFPSAVGIDFDLNAHGQDAQQKIDQLAAAASRCDVVIACQPVPALMSALEGMAVHPPLIEWGRTLTDALSAATRHSSTYVAPTAPIRRTVARPLPDRSTAVLISPLSPTPCPTADQRWRNLLDAAHSAQRPARPPALFRSFWQGGFESSTHRRADGKRIDVIADVGHDTYCEADYRQLRTFGLHTVRDAVRWHLIEPSPGTFDFTSLRPMRDAARRSGVQVVWDLLHYGWPDDLDVWRPDFVTRFARFAAAVGRFMRDGSDAPPFWCPVNEISFLSWAGGDVAAMNPFGRDRGFELKVQMARASIAAMEELKRIDSRARFVHCEPAVVVHPNPDNPAASADVAGWHEAQFQAFDLISGRLWPQIGGKPEFLDVLGLNYYDRNQWVLGGGHLPRTDPRYRPLADILHNIFARYGRPLCITETGTEGDDRAGWFAYVLSEVLKARARGVPVEGLCLYPIVDHPGWDNDRICPNGLLSHVPSHAGRAVHHPLADVLTSAQLSHTTLTNPAAASRRTEQLPGRGVVRPVSFFSGKSGGERYDQTNPAP